MPTMTLPQQTIDRIKKDSHHYAGDSMAAKSITERMAYQAGATAEATRAMEREKILVENEEILLSEITNLSNELRRKDAELAAVNSSTQVLVDALRKISDKYPDEYFAGITAREALTNYAGEGEVGE